MFNAYFEVQMLCFYWFWFFECIEDKICVDVECLIHILKHSVIFL